jgi:5-methylcytosine-specific restriction endonuclease McrA
MWKSTAWIERDLVKHYKTLVLNANGMPLSIVSWGRGIYLVYDEKAQELDFYAGEKVRDGHGRYFTIPAVVILRRMISTKHRSASFNKKNVLLRDGLTCQYCGRQFEPKDLTLDHVIPRCKWKSDETPTNWENVVTCCCACNTKKGDKTCEQADMHPIKKPVKPRHGERFLGLSPWRDRIPKEWLPYLSHLPLFKGLVHEQQTTL